MRALEILDAAGTLGDGNPLVFPMRRGTPILASTLPKMLQRDLQLELRLRDMLRVSGIEPKAPAEQTETSDAAPEAEG